MVKMKKNRLFFGTAKVGERGQIVIPKEAREMFKIKPNDSILVIGDKEKGLVIAKTGIMKKFASQVMESFNVYEQQDNLSSKGK